MPRLRVGDWLLDPAMNQISRRAKVERLEPKAVEVLVALAQRAGEVVTRETLLSEVWKGVTVSDDALTQSITKLRQALGDTSKESSYIQTISKRGYRLIAAWRRTTPAPWRRLIPFKGLFPHFATCGSHIGLWRLPPS
jgi:DNA-binding winged helix-turn-helix (wHTH) protein